MGDVIPLHGWTKLDIPVERVLDGAKDQEMVLVLSWSKEGIFSAAASTTNTLEVVSMAQRFIHKYYNGDYDDE